MATLAEKRKDAIKAHDKSTQVIIKDLDQISAAMRVVGLAEGAEKIERLVRSIKYDLTVLKTSGSVN